MLKSVRRVFVFAVTVGTLALMTGSSASAMYLTVRAGGSNGGNNLGGGAYGTPSTFSPLLGGELTYGFSSLFQFGGYYDHNIVSSYADGSSGSMQSFGAVARVGLGFLTNVFVDGKIGAARLSAGGQNASLALGWGVGMGYRFSLGPIANLSPHLGVRNQPNHLPFLSEKNVVMFDGSLLLTLGF